MHCLVTQSYMHTHCSFFIKPVYHKYLSKFPSHKFC